MFALKDLIQFLGFLATIVAGVWYLARSLHRVESKLERLDERSTVVSAQIQEIKADQSLQQRQISHLDTRVTVIEDRQPHRFIERENGAA